MCENCGLRNTNRDLRPNTVALLHHPLSCCTVCVWFVDTPWFAAQRGRPWFLLQICLQGRGGRAVQLGGHEVCGLCDPGEIEYGAGVPRDGWSREKDPRDVIRRPAAASGPGRQVPRSVRSDGASV